MLNVDMFILLGDVTYLITIVGLLLHIYRKESCAGKFTFSVHAFFLFHLGIGGLPATDILC
jgi:hypothetical protein